MTVDPQGCLHNPLSIYCITKQETRHLSPLSTCQTDLVACCNIIQTLVLSFKLLCISESTMLNRNAGTPDRRLYSTILAEFPWYSEALVEKPRSPLDLSNKLPGFEVSIIH